MKVLTAHIPLPLASQIDDYSARMERSRGWIVKQALEDWVAKQEQRQHGFAEASMKFTYDTSAAKAVETLKTLRETTTLGPIPWQELRDAGRK
jgi:metal-responsive CopG/Arc/MetJ family transcriptional regulator